MKKLGALALIVCMLFSRAGAEEALTVNGMSVSAAEARLCLIDAESSYAEVVAYYRDLLGIDYWSLTLLNGMTAAEAVKSDVFQQLLTMNLFYALARAEGLRLSPEESAACKEDARAYYASLTVSAAEDVTVEDVEQLIMKQRLADSMYGILLSRMEIDEAAVTAAIDPADYLTLGIEYLLCPETDAQAEAVLSALRDESDWSNFTLTNIIYGQAELCRAARASFAALYDNAAPLAVGETTGVIKTDHGLFLIRLNDDGSEAAYLAAVEQALYEARAAAFEEELSALFAEAEYTINVAFWDSVTLGSAGAR